MQSGTFYNFTAASVEEMIQKASAAIHTRCCHPCADFSVFERGPGLYCTGRTTTEGYRLLTFTQVQEFTEAAAYTKCLEAPTPREQFARLKALNAIHKTVTLHIAMDHAPAECIPGLPARLLRAWRAIEKKRTDPEKRYPLPWASEPWHPQVIKQRARRETPWWRTICINPRKQTPEDIFFQLTLILLQEQMISEAEITTCTNAMVRHLCTQSWGCSDISTARLVLDRVQRHFTEPKDWDGLRRYIQAYLSWERRKETPGTTFNKRRKETGADAAWIAVEDALIQLQEAGLPTPRGTLYRWAQDWAMKTPGLALYDRDRGFWLTKEGVAKAREKRLLKILTKAQITRGKEKDAARKFTYRHKLSIQEALARGDRIEDIAQALLSGDRARRAGNME